MDALATERREGVRVGPAYAIAASDGSSDNAAIQDSWYAKNVEPIVYDEIDSHRLLSDTLVEWARVRADPHAKSRIALDGITTLASPIGDPDAARITWALGDPEVARTLAESPPFTEEQDFTKIEGWLDVFESAGLLSRPERDVEHDQSPRVHLVDTGTTSHNPPAVDRVTAHLARWIARHVHVPQLLGWVVRRGGRVHPELRCGNSTKPRGIRSIHIHPPTTQALMDVAVSIHS